MTLVVSLRIPDGLVIAADSLSSAPGQLGVVANLEGVCPTCKNKINLKDIKMPPIPIPGATSSYAQKLFSFKKRFGVACFGMGILTHKTIYYHMKGLEEKVEEFKDVSKLTPVILEYFDKEVRKEIKDIDQAPDDFFPLGFHLNGYDGETGKTIEINIGKKSRYKEIVGLGCTVSGDTDLVVQMWELGKKDPRRSTNFGRFSLQDAIDYAHFLITATAEHQRFTNIMPSVGGEVDIALVTPFHQFRWIRYKELTKILEIL
jgi:hypothetical protein